MPDPLCQPLREIDMVMGPAVPQELYDALRRELPMLKDGDRVLRRPDGSIHYAGTATRESSEVLTPYFRRAEAARQDRLDRAREAHRRGDDGAHHPGLRRYLRDSA